MRNIVLNFVLAVVFSTYCSSQTLYNVTCSSDVVLSSSVNNCATCPDETLFTGIILINSATGDSVRFIDYPVEVSCVYDNSGDATHYYVGGVMYSAIQFPSISNCDEWSAVLGCFDPIGDTSIMTDSNDGKTIATHLAGGITTNIEETVTTLVYNGDGTFTYTAEDGTVTTILIDNTGGNTSNTSVFTNLISGNRIGTHYDGIGVTVDIDETITSIVDNDDGTFTYTAEGGATTTINLFDLLTEYANHIEAGVGGVPIGGLFISSQSNSMGAVPGTVIRRKY